jgi:hypothetical protein
MRNSEKILKLFSKKEIEDAFEAHGFGIDFEHLKISKLNVEKIGLKNIYQKRTVRYPCGTYCVYREKLTLRFGQFMASYTN